MSYFVTPACNALMWNSSESREMLFHRCFLRRSSSISDHGIERVDRIACSFSMIFLAAISTEHTERLLRICTCWLPCSAHAGSVLTNQPQAALERVTTIIGVDLS